MHSGLHTLAHRAPTGARSRVRWQPYASLQSSISSSSMPSRSPQTSYLNTPTSVPPSSPYSTPSSSCSDRSKPTPPPLTPSTSTTKDPQSKKHAIGLVDQAVKTICDIWRSEDIPTVFLTADRATLAQLPVKVGVIASTTDLLSKSRNRNTQLPSPISPKTRPSPPTANCTPVTIIEIEPTCMFGSKTNLVPIKGFVHEVLRRSRTSGCVLQTALCYLEAIRPRLPDLRKQEQMTEPDITTRISPATPAEWDNDYDSNYSDGGMDTIRINDTGSATISLDNHEPIPEGDTLKRPKGPSPPLSPLPPLPSPLLCPRRAFLAALILASKFTQDKCYSNRAWAKLSGLPAREIGRCERALGDALDWRLWVGKQAQTATLTPPSPPLVSRPVTRCRSESDLRTERLATFIVTSESKPSNVPPGPSRHSGIRRSSTLPPDAFSAPRADTKEPEDSFMSSPEAFSSSLSQESVHSSCEEYLVDCPPTEVVYPINSFNSPSPPTPTLPYSPTPTESPSGDRTIQNSYFLDESVPPLPPCVAGAESFIWSETSPPHLGTIYNANPTWSSFTSHSAVHRIPSFYDLKLLHTDGFTAGFDQNSFGFSTVQVEH